MEKLSIQLEGGSLDIYKQGIEWEWTDIRFSDGIKDQYSTDVSLPKTVNNMHLLAVSGLLDSTSQLYGSQIRPCVLCIDGVMMDVYMQVVGITEDDISVCLYQRTLPDKVFGKRLNEICHDTPDTIWVWSVNTETAYPQDFPVYRYGSPFNDKYAQRHPTKPLDWVINRINSELQDFTLPTVDSSLRLMGAQKKVCPENPHQVIEGTFTDSDTLVVVGGQHVVNDVEGWDGLSKVGESTTKEITFNRSVDATIDIYAAWCESGAVGSHTYYLSIYKNGDFVTGIAVQTNLGGLRTGVIHPSHPWQMHFSQGDVLEFGIEGASASNIHNKFKMFSAVFDITYTNYTITDDDYGTDLVYCHKHPSLKTFNPAATDGYDNQWFDGRTVNIYSYAVADTTPISPVTTLTLPWRGISYIGYWCNIGDIKLKELYFGLCWLYSKKPVRSLDTMTLVDADESAVLSDGAITEIRPSSDVLGKRTTVSWSDGEGEKTVVSIDNEWLEDTVSRHESPFVRVEKVAGGLAKVNQYEITGETDEDGNTTYDVEYTEPEGAVLLRYGQYGRLNRWGLVPPPEIDPMGLEKLTQCMEADIETYDTEVKDKDYLYYNGRKFMVVEGSTDLSSGKSTITTLLVPTAAPIHAHPVEPFQHG